MPALLIARIADSRPPPGPFTRTSHCCIPASCAFFAASHAACCAANGVPLREPRNPRAPEDDCAIKFPSRSVIEIIVLLNDAAMYAIPLGIFFFSFLRKTFFFPPAVAFAIILGVGGQGSGLVKCLYRHLTPDPCFLLLARSFLLRNRCAARAFACARV